MPKRLFWAVTRMAFITGEARDEEHEKRLAGAYGWRHLFRAMVGTVAIPLVLVLVSPRWAAYVSIPCVIAFVALIRVAMKRREPLVLAPGYDRMLRRREKANDRRMSK